MPARTQEESPPKYSSLIALAELLPEAAWNTTERGPLVIVGAEITTAQLTKANLPPKSRSGHSLTALAPLFSLRPVRLPTLTVFAPTFRADLGERADLLPSFRWFARENPDSLQLRFFGDLTDPQWRLVTGIGIGIKDLTVGQRRLLEKRFSGYTHLQSDGKATDVKSETLPLTAAHRSAFRLRLVERYTYRLLNSKGEAIFDVGSANQPWRLIEPDIDRSFSTVITMPNRLRPGQLDLDASHFERRVTLRSKETVSSLVGRIRKASGMEMYVDPRFGRLIVHSRAAPSAMVPARDLLKALLWGTCGTFRYVGEKQNGAYLLTQGIEGLQTRGARLNDEQFRAMLPGFVGVVAASAAGEAIADEWRSKNPNRSISVPKDELFIPPASLNVPLARRDLPPPVDGERTAPARYSVAQLPSALQKKVREAVEDSINFRAFDEHETASINRTEVEICRDIFVEVLLPGFGVVHQERFPSLPTPARSTTPPASSDIDFPTGIAALELSAATPTQATESVAAARQNGFAQVWLQLPRSVSEVQGKKVLKAAIEAGRGSGDKPAIAVVAVLGVRGRDLPEQADDNSDMTVFGGSAAKWTGAWLEDPLVQQLPVLVAQYGSVPDWLRTDSVALKHRFRTITALARTPGLSGVALHETIPSGAFGSAGYVATPHFSPDIGYTVAARLAFLRRWQTDPIDITSWKLWGQFDVKDTRVPFVFFRSKDGRAPEVIPISDAWDKVRLKAHRKMMARLYGVLRGAAMPENLRLYVRDPLESWSENGFWGEWGSAAIIPGFITKDIPNDEDTRLTPASAARVSARTVLHVISDREETLRQRIEERVGIQRKDAGESDRFFRVLSKSFDRMQKQAQAGSPWDGFVLDLADRPLPQAIRLLNAMRDRMSPARKK